MITTIGKGVVKNFFALQSPQVSNMIAVGIGNTPAALTDDRLSHEILRFPVASVTPDALSDRVVFKGTLSPGLIGTIYEVGIFLDDAVQEPGRIINLVDPFGIWTNATIVSGSGRANARTVKIDFVASGTTNAELTGLYYDLSAYTSPDSLLLSFTATANLSSLRVRLGADASNYYEFVVTSPAVGYNMRKIDLAAATIVGAPTLAAVRYLAIRPSATAAGGGSVNFDSLRFENAPTPGSLLVARTVLATPYVTDTVIPGEIEYSLRVAAS